MRNVFNFFIKIISSLGILLGSGLAIGLKPGVEIAFGLLLVSIVGFQMTDIYVYTQVKKNESNL